MRRVQPMSLEDPSMIPVRLARLILRDHDSQQSIFLTEEGGERGFPIVIGTGEAHEIRRVLSSEQPPRPMTHQLAFDAIGALGARLERVEIFDLRENTFFARLVLASEGESEVVLDARPSDALALALRAGCDIRVSESLLEQVRTDPGGPDPLPDGPEESGEPDEPQP